MPSNFQHGNEADAECANDRLHLRIERNFNSVKHEEQCKAM